MLQHAVFKSAGIQPVAYVSVDQSGPNLLTGSSPGLVLIVMVHDCLSLCNLGVSKHAALLSQLRT